MSHPEPFSTNRSDARPQRTSQRDRARIDPIKLAGMPLLSLDAPGGSNIVSADAATVRIDWPAALRQAGFTPDEAAVFELAHLSQCPNPAAILRWRPARFARASVAVKAKFQDRLPVLRAAIEQQMHWAVPSVDPFYADVIAAERLKPTIHSLGGKYRTMKPTTLTLEGQLQAAREKLQQLRVILAQRSDDQNHTRAALAVAEAAATRELEDALIEVRQPTAKHSAAVPGLRKRLETADEGVTAAQGAVRRQSDECERLQGEIESNARAKLMGDLAPLLKQFDAAITAAMPAADKIQSLVVGRWLSPRDVFPGERDDTARALRNEILTQIIEYVRYERLFGNDLAA